MTKKEVYIRAIKALPKYFVDEATEFATVDENNMIAANPQFAPIWYQEDDKIRKPKWKVVTDPSCPFEFKNGEFFKKLGEDND
jgi:hypothetical protein